MTISKGNLEAFAQVGPMFGIGAMASELLAARERIAALEACARAMTPFADRCVDVEAKLAALEAENLRLREALEMPITPMEWSEACPAERHGIKVAVNGVANANRVLQTRRAALEGSKG